jgi:hypothetical protein
MEMFGKLKAPVNFQISSRLSLLGLILGTDIERICNNLPVRCSFVSFHTILCNDGCSVSAQTESDRV